MTARILIVDDVPANLKVLEAKLNNYYYDVISASNGVECISKVRQFDPDIILLDIMMPVMDGFEACKRLKADHHSLHIPIIIITALNDKQDKMRGLESGADDFLTKPIDDTALLIRIKTLVRIKIMADELRLRYQTANQLGIVTDNVVDYSKCIQKTRILIIDDDLIQASNMRKALKGRFEHISICKDPDNAMESAINGDFDIIIVDMMIAEADCYRICSQFRSHELTRSTPILMLIDEGNLEHVFKSSEVAGNDYLIVPLDSNELVARVILQAKRKQYQDALKVNLQNDIEMSFVDSLTGCYNRRYFDKHLLNEFNESRRFLCLMIVDIDHFKKVNDTLGHLAGDKVLADVSSVIKSAIRPNDLLARYGGEEFVCVVCDKLEVTLSIAEKLRSLVESHVFDLSKFNVNDFKVTVSVGVTARIDKDSDPSELIARADSSLYKAKSLGRNVVYHAIPE